MLSPSIFFYAPEYKVIPTKFRYKGPECESIKQCLDFDINSICNAGYCICKKGYQLLKDSVKCVKCPGYNSACIDNCCAAPELICINNICSCEDPTGPYCPNPQSGVFVTASQIALSAALIMGIAALAMVIYRLCTKPKYETARQRAERRMRDRDSIDGHNRLSLSSMQVRILSRLRDRPPPYQGEQIPSVIPIAAQNLENPPSYNCARDLVTHLPPPYTEIVLNPSGYLNQSFENTEPLANSININTENRTTNKNVIKDDDDTMPIENSDINNNNNINNNCSISK